MIFGVDDVEDVAVQGHTLGMVECSCVKIPVGPTNSATPGDIEHLPIEVSYDNAVVVGVRDKESLRRRMGEDFAGEGQGATGVLVFFQRKMQGCIVESALAFGLSDELINDAFEDFLMAFTGEMAQDIAIGPDHHQRRPGPHRILPPDMKVAVVDHGMLDLIAQDRLADVGRVAFVLEFCRMHANNHQFPGILLFQGGQFGDDVHAIDAAVGPEIQ